MRTLAAATLLCLVACASEPPPATPEPPPATPTSPATSASAATTADMPSATAAVAPTAPTDPMLAGLSGEDLDWATKCLDGKGSYCTKFGNQAEFVTKQYDKGFAWYKKGCEAKSVEPVSCMGLARLMINGQGTTADVAGGLKLWESTCSMEGGRDSCGELAKAYDKGSYGVTKSAAKAKAIYGKACDLNDLNACKKAGKKPPKS